MGIEGMMLVGALAGFATTAMTGSPLLGFAAGIAGGTALSAIHAFLTVSLKADQIISGLMLTLLGISATTYYGTPWTTASITGFRKFSLPIVGPYLTATPIGQVLFHNTLPTFLSFLLVPAVWYFLNHTNLGLVIKAVGEDPETADTAGISVTRTRYIAVLLGGAFSGAAGAHLSLAFSNLWVSGMVAGRGWIALALVIVVQWRPVRALVGAYAFGFIDVLQLRTQGIDFVALVPGSQFDGLVAFLANPTIMGTYPFVATILVLTAVSAYSLNEEIGAPGAYLEPYIRS
ncbi:MAG: ABC transporter permease [Haloferacaceae archaeon]